MFPIAIRALFLDIGGVLLTNGWDRQMRRQSVKVFHLDESEVDERHHLTFDTYEEGKLTLDEYLDRVVFYRPQPFTRQEFKEYMFAQSQPYPEMINLIKELKKRYQLKIAVVSNEGRELTVHRIQKFQLGGFVDFFISSCFVHYRKPDLDIFRIALDVAQMNAEQVAYIEDRQMFVDVVQGLGIWGIHHTGYEETRRTLEKMGLSVETPKHKREKKK
jgi:putative hydrolase of the HAD superfamily